MWKKKIEYHHKWLPTKRNKTKKDIQREEDFWKAVQRPLLIRFTWRPYYPATSLLQVPRLWFWMGCSNRIWTAGITFPEDFILPFSSNFVVIALWKIFVSPTMDGLLLSDLDSRVKYWRMVYWVLPVGASDVISLWSFYSDKFLCLHL